jgi:hypothetical protein
MLYHAVRESVHKVGVLIVRSMKGKVANSHFVLELQETAIISLFCICNKMKYVLYLYV